MRSPRPQNHVLRLLEALESGAPLSQRTLSSQLGIALGRTNQLLRRLVADGRIKVRRGAGQRREYVVTPAGAEARARMTREVLGHAVALFAPARDRIRTVLGEIAAGVEEPGTARAGVVLHAAEDVAYIVYACAVESGVEVVGFVGDESQPTRLGVPARGWTALTPEAFDGRRFDRLLVVAPADEADVWKRLDGIGFPHARVSWL